MYYILKEADTSINFFTFGNLWDFLWNASTLVNLEDSRKEAAVKWHNEHSNVPALTTSQVQEEVDKIINSVDIGGLGTLSTLMNLEDSQV